jgi:hypothetical protein
MKAFLNMAEIELSVLKGQCLDSRIPDMPTMQTAVNAWENARIKLKRLYPNL